ncbi:MAG: hypothetical protein ACOVP5_02595, partial [Chitinophagales bacterium]
GHFGLINLMENNIALLVGFLVVINYLLISNTPMFSNKSIKKQFRGNIPFIIIGIIGLIGILFFGYLGISIAILSYVLMSLLSLRLKILKF